MTPSPRHAHRSGAISSSTIAAGRIRALTAARPITPTSPRCPSAWQPSPAEAPLIDAEKLFRQPGPRQYPQRERKVLIDDVQCIVTLHIGNHANLERKER